MQKPLNNFNSINSNSIIRKIILNKEEYFLAFSNEEINLDKIENFFINNTNEDFCIGKIELFKQKPTNGQYIKYFNENGKIFNFKRKNLVSLKNTLNKSLINDNDNENNISILLKRIFNILRGNNFLEIEIEEKNKNEFFSYGNETYSLEEKIQNEKKKIYFKILLRSKSDITFVIFNCEMNKFYLENEIFFLENLSNFFIEKQKISKNFTKILKEKIEENENTITKFHQINKSLEFQKKKFLEKVEIFFYFF